jgi:hypothetical protein
MKVVNEYRFFTVKKHKYVWDTELGTFFPTQGTDTNIRYTELGTFFPTQGTDTNIRYTELDTLNLNTFNVLILKMFTLKSEWYEGNKKCAL